MEPANDSDNGTPQFAVRATSRDDVLDRVRTSLFDILSSATRRPVNPHWRPGGGGNTRTNFNSNATTTTNIDNTLGNRRNNRNRNHNVGRDPRHQLLTSIAPASGPRQRASKFSATYLDGNDNDDDDDDDDDVILSDDEGDNERADDMNEKPELFSSRLSPLAILSVAAVLALIAVFALDARVSSRRGRISASTRIGVPVVNAMGSVGIPVLKATRQALKLLFRNAWRDGGRETGAEKDGVMTTLEAVERAVEARLSSDVVTRSELREIVLPELLSAARKVAERTAGDALEEERRERAQRQEEEEKEKQRLKEMETHESGDFNQFAERFAADKDLPPDFALGSAGGAIIDTVPSALSQWARFARSYASALVTERRFTPTRPRPASIVLEPDVLPGNCWAFDGAQGSLTIRLARPVRVSAVSLEHTPRNSVFSISSAVHGFRVVGLPVMAEMQEIVLVEGVFNLFDKRSRHLQTFPVETTEDDEDKISIRTVLRAVRMEILSNHGANFTTVYRVRVHGEGEGEVNPFEGVDGEEL